MDGKAGSAGTTAGLGSIHLGMGFEWTLRHEEKCLLFWGQDPLQEILISETVLPESARETAHCRSHHRGTCACFCTKQRVPSLCALVLVTTRELILMTSRVAGSAVAIPGLTTAASPGPDAFSEDSGPPQAL